MKGPCRIILPVTDIIFAFRATLKVAIKGCARLNARRRRWDECICVSEWAREKERETSVVVKKKPVRYQQQRRYIPAVENRLVGEPSVTEGQQPNTAGNGRSRRDGAEPHESGVARRPARWRCADLGRVRSLTMVGRDVYKSSQQCAGRSAGRTSDVRGVTYGVVGFLSLFFFSFSFPLPPI